MFKKITVLIVVLLSLTLTWYIRQYNSKHTSAQIGKTLVVGTSADYYPFAFIKDDEYAGFDLDIIKKIGNIINKDIIIKNMPFNTLLIELRLGHIDMIAAGMTPSPARARKILYTNPYLTNDPLIAVSMPENLISSDPNKLLDKKVVVNLGYTADNYLTQQLKMEPLRLDTIGDLFLALQNRHAKVVIGAKSTLTPYLKKHIDKQYNVVQLDAPSETYAFAVSLTDKKLATRINQALQTMQENGILKVIKNKWGF